MLARLGRQGGAGQAQTGPYEIKVWGWGCTHCACMWMRGGGRTLATGVPMGRDEVVVEHSASCWSSWPSFLRRAKWGGYGSTW